MYLTTTTTPQFHLMSDYNTHSVRSEVIPSRRATPEDIQKYLVDMGWAPYSASDGDWMYTRADIGLQNFMTWEQAVTYCLVKPYLEAYK